MRKSFLFIWRSMIVIVFTTGCVTSERYRALSRQYETDTQALKMVADELSRKKSELESELDRCKLQLKILSSELESQKEKYHTALKLNEEIRKDLENFIKKYPGELEWGPKEQLIIKDKILFEPGKAQLKEEGKKVLEEFVNEVIKGKNLYLRIVGHTDSDPIVKTLPTWKTGLNHELGGARALAVLAYLHKKGISTTNMHFESYGENEPLVENNTKENKARNRRVEIYIIEK
ncbi:MAG: flagellar motor protein MotB [Planctomycetota bacterium]